MLIPSIVMKDSLSLPFSSQWHFSLRQCAIILVIQRGSNCMWNSSALQFDFAYLPRKPLWCLKKLLLKPCQCVSQLWYNAFHSEYTLSSIFWAGTTDIEIFSLVLVHNICQTYSRLFFVFDFYFQWGIPWHCPVFVWGAKKWQSCTW